jgi:hypothetical protein
VLELAGLVAGIGTALEHGNDHDPDLDRGLRRREGGGQQDEGKYSLRWRRTVQHRDWSKVYAKG